MVSEERRGWPAQVRNLVGIATTSGAVALVKNRSPETREAVLRSLMKMHDRNADLFDPTHPNGRALHRRERIINSELVRNGFFSQNTNPGAFGPFTVERVTEDSYPELYRQMNAMNHSLNERHGTRLPIPELLIVDNDQQLPMYINDSNQIVISKDVVEQGHAPAMIAHELAERLNHFTHGDRRLLQEIQLRNLLDLPLPDEVLRQHRSNECREDANEASLVGPERSRAAFAYLIGKIRPLPAPDDLASDMRGLFDPLQYPTDRQRLRLLNVLEQRPDLLQAMTERPHQVRFDEACNMSVVEERGAPTSPMANGTEQPRGYIPPR